MRIQSIYTKKVYEDDGVKKTHWYKAGYLKTTEFGNQYICMFNQPQVDYFVSGEESEEMLEEK